MPTRPTSISNCKLWLSQDMIVESGARDYEETGGDQYHYVASHADFEFSGAQDFTCIHMGKLESTSSQMVSFSKDNASVERSWALWKAAGQTTWRFLVSGDGSGITSVTGSTSVGTTNWFMAGGQHDATADEINVIVNGSTDATAVSHTSGVYNASATNLAIGAHYSSGSPASEYDGLISASGLWSRLLTASELTWLYNGGIGRTYDELGVVGTDGSDLLTDLVGWWEGNEESGNLLDRHTGAHHMTDNNSVGAANGPDWDKVQDESSNSNHATRNGSTSLADMATDDVPSALASQEWAARFNGTDDHFIIDAGYVGAGDFSVSLWVKVAATGANEMLYTEGRSSTANGQIFIDKHSDDTFRCVFEDNTGTGAVVAQSTTTANDTWVHLCGTKNGTSLKLYVSGSEEGSATTTAGSFTPERNAIGARRRNTTDLYADADIADVQIFNADIGASAASDIADGTGYTTNQVGRWLGPATNMPGSGPADGDVIVIWRDRSGNGNHAQQNTVASRPTAETSAYARDVADFDGAADVLNVANSTDFNMSSNDFTVMFWMRTHTLGAITHMLASWDYTPNQRAWMVRRSASDELELYTSSNGTSSKVVTTTNASLATNTWTHLCAVKSGTAVTFYQDATALTDDGTAVDATLHSSTGVVSIADLPTSSNLYNGELFSPIVYNGTALTQAQIQGVMEYTDPTVVEPQWPAGQMLLLGVG